MATINSINTELPIEVASGGTGKSSLTAYTPLCGGTTTTAPIQPVASIGSSSEVLTSTGASSLPTFQAGAGAGSMVLIETQTVSTNTLVVDFTTGIDSTYETYILLVSRYTTEGTGDGFRFQIKVSTNGGLSFLADAKYCVGNHYVAYNSATYTANPVGDGNQWNFTNFTNATHPCAFHVMINSIGQTTKFPSLTTFSSIVNSSGTLYYAAGSGSRSQTDTINAIRVFTSDAGNTDILTGKFSLYGITQ